MYTYIDMASVLCWMTGEAITGCHKYNFVSPWPRSQFYWTGQLALYPVITTICHKFPTLGKCVQSQSAQTIKYLVVSKTKSTLTETNVVPLWTCNNCRWHPEKGLQHMSPNMGYHMECGIAGRQFSVWYQTNNAEEGLPVLVKVLRVICM